MKWSLPKGLERWKEALGQYRTILLVLAVGVALMLLPTGKPKSEPELPPESAAEEFDLAAFEKRLSDALSQVEGAGETRVLLTLKSGSRRVLAQDMERDGTRASTSAVVLGRGSASQEVVALQTLSPQFQGALVVCPGGEDPEVRLRLSSAVSALTGLGSDRISICKST